MFVHKPLVGYVSLAMRRDRIVHFLLFLMLAGFGISVILGSAAVIEKNAFSIAMAGTVLRMLAVLGIVVFISFFIRRLFETREIDYFLATPLTRPRIIGSISLAFIVFAILLSVLIAVIMLFLIGSPGIGWLVWSLSVVTELSITVMMAIFFSIVIRSATVATICCLGFYSLARMLGLMIGILDTKIEYTNIFYVAINYIVKFISVVTPRFDLLSQSSWLVYNDIGSFAWWILPAQFIAFVILFFLCALYDFKKVQF